MQVLKLRLVSVGRGLLLVTLRLCSRWHGQFCGSSCSEHISAPRPGFVELVSSARASCASRKRGENRRFIALSLFPSSERSHQKTQADKAHRPPLDDFTAMSKAERAPERSLVQPAAHDKKRLRDCSSERSEGRLPQPGLSGGAWALLHIQPLSPPPALERGQRTASGPWHHCSIASWALTASSLRVCQAGSHHQKVLLFHARCSSALAVSGAQGPFLSTTSTALWGCFANVTLGFLPPSLCSVEASHGRRWPKLLVSSCEPHTSQPYSPATVHLLRRLCSCQCELTGHLQHRCEYLVPLRGF